MMDTKGQIVAEIINTRRSPRAFEDRAVEPDKLERIFEAARWAASSMNEQPWRFVFATRDNPGDFDKIKSVLMDGNVIWAQHAAVLVLTLAKKTLSKNSRDNKHAWHDVGLAVGNLSIMATALGLSVHQMGGFYPEKAIETFHLPQDYQPVSVIAIGYVGDPQKLPEPLRSREQAPRQRLPLDQIVFEGEFPTG